MDDCVDIISAKYVKSKMLSNLNVIADNYEVKWNIKIIDISDGDERESFKFSTGILRGSHTKSSSLHNDIKIIHWNLQLRSHSDFSDKYNYGLWLTCEFDKGSGSIDKIQVRFNSIICNGTSIELDNPNEKFMFGEGNYHKCIKRFMDLNEIMNAQRAQGIPCDEDSLTIVCNLVICENIIDETHFDSEPMDKIRNMFNKEKYSDVIILVGDDKFFAHKIVLSIRSDVFEAMFDHNVVESIKKEIRIEDFDQKTVESMLKFIYFKEPTQISFDLLAIANKYNIKLLKKLCERTLRHGICKENVVESLKAADMHEGAELKAFAFYFLIKKFWYFKESLREEIKELSKDLLVDLLTEVSGLAAQPSVDII